MDFLTWWFDEHYIVSTIVTPALSIAWAIYKDRAIRLLLSFVVLVLLYSNSRQLK